MYGVFLLFIDECSNNDLAEVFNNSELFFVLNDDKISMQPISNCSNNAPINGINLYILKT